MHTVTTVNCCECGVELEQEKDGTFTHPATKGVWNPRPIVCSLVGKRFARQIELVEIAPGVREEKGLCW